MNRMKDGPNPWRSRLMIPAATNLVIVAKDQGGAAMLELQRLESEAKEERKPFSKPSLLTAEDKLEALRDDLRILQAEPSV
jgi:stringent starvation protein B